MIWENFFLKHPNMYDPVRTDKLLIVRTFIAWSIDSIKYGV